MREGLIVDEAVGTWDYEPAWFLTAYGYRFLRFLPGASPQQLMGATVVGVWANGNVDRLLLKNLGPGQATVRQMSIALGPTPTSIQHATPVPIVEDEGTLVAGENLEISPELPVTIEPGQSRHIACLGQGAKVLFASTTLHLTWVDEAGQVNEGSCTLPHRG